MSRFWYAYTGGTGNKPQLDAVNYVRILANKGKPSCSGVGTICAIYVPSGFAQPDSPLSLNIKDYIQNALVSGVPEPVFPNKPYAYVKIG